MEMKLWYPCAEGWGSQKYHSGHKGLDFGWVYKANCDIYACADGVVEFEGFYSQAFSSGTVKPIGVLIRHPQFDNEYDYISIYWHLASTIINKGDYVKAGQKIGVKGNSGLSSGTHLHFQMLKIKKGAAIPDQHYPSKADNWGKASIDPTPFIYVHSGQLYMNDKSQFKLKDYVDIPEESNDIYSLQARIKSLEDEIETYKKEMSDCSSLNKTLEDELKTAKDDNLMFAKENEYLKSVNETYLNTIDRIKELINNG